ncbi:hypothetical protein CLS_04210 [[Clostridium] cf. saccharolyticum K10]|nr:hypothetical protein CLS_04210 [[Clostridium] cf. saccharolyticum K10]
MGDRNCLHHVQPDCSAAGKMTVIRGESNV